MVYVSVKPHKVGIGALLKIFSTFIPYAKKFGVVPCLNYKDLVYLQNTEVSVETLQSVFKIGISVGEAVFFAEASSFRASKIYTPFEKIIDLPTYEGVHKAFDVSVHARFGYNEIEFMKKNPDRMTDDNIKCIKDRRVKEQRFWDEMDKKKNARFFVASDCSNFLRLTKQRYGYRCFIYNNEESDVMHLNPSSGINSMYCALRDLYTLKRGKAIICNNSALNWYARQSCEVIRLV